MFRLKPADSVHIKVAKEITSLMADNLQLEQGMLELWYDKVFLALEQLLTSTYNKSSLYQKAQAIALKDVVRKILTNPRRNQFINRGDERVLEEGLTDSLEAARKILNERVSPVEISIFCQLAEKGRELFKARNIRPDIFAPEDIYKLALLIRGNYGAYEDALRGLQV